VATAESEPFVPADADRFCVYCGFPFRDHDRGQVYCRQYARPGHGRCGRRRRDAQSEEGLKERLRRTQAADPYARQTSVYAIAHEWVRQRYPDVNLERWQPARGDAPRRGTGALWQRHVGSVIGQSPDEPRDQPASPTVLEGQSLPRPDAADLRGAAGVTAADYGVGDVIDDRCEVKDILGKGGFSRVYRVRDDVEDEERALKLFNNARGYEAVRREIGALPKIRHPNVVEVYWTGKTSTGDWYLVTEFIEGDPLSEFVGGTRALQDREAVDIALDLLDALVAFHPDAERLNELDARSREGDLSGAEYDEWMDLKEKGLVHRDIKPLNVLLTRTGAKLLDFNIASRVGDEVLTRSGTPPYQPPEANFTLWDVAPDLFAVGVVLYELLCDGQHPYPYRTLWSMSRSSIPGQFALTSTPA